MGSGDGCLSDNELCQKVVDGKLDCERNKISFSSRRSSLMVRSIVEKVDNMSNPKECRGN